MEVSKWVTPVRNVPSTLVVWDDFSFWVDGWDGWLSVLMMVVVSVPSEEGTNKAVFHIFGKLFIKINNFDILDID